MKTVGVAILCRTSSSRLPGKVLKPINGKTIIQHIYDRVAQIVPKENIVITTSTEASDDVIEEYCKENDLKYFRGDLNDVAKRFLDVGVANKWDYVTRINGDNLFIDLETVSTMVEIAQENKFDFISNVKGRTFPYGMSVELVNVAFYKQLYTTVIANNDGYKEHVTLCLYENEDLGKIHFHYNTKFPEAKGWKFAVDTQEDFDRVEKIMNKITDDYSLVELINAYKNEE